MNSKSKSLSKHKAIEKIKARLHGMNAGALDKRAEYITKEHPEAVYGKYKK